MTYDDKKSGENIIHLIKRGEIIGVVEGCDQKYEEDDFDVP